MILWSRWGRIKWQSASDGNECITAIGGAAFVWPLAAHAQQAEQARRVGMLWRIAADDPTAQAEYAAFLQGLRQLGWIEGRNVHIDPRGAGAQCRRPAQIRS